MSGAVKDRSQRTAQVGLGIERRRRAAILAWGTAPGYVGFMDPRAEGPIYSQSPSITILAAMPQSFALIIIHLVFSTKDRAPLLTAPIRAALHSYASPKPSSLGCPILDAKRQAGAPDERSLLDGVERGVSFAEANDRLPLTP